MYGLHNKFSMMSITTRNFAPTMCHYFSIIVRGELNSRLTLVDCNSGSRFCSFFGCQLLSLPRYDWHNNIRLFRSSQHDRRPFSTLVALGCTITPIFDQPLVIRVKVFHWRTENVAAVCKRQLKQIFDKRKKQHIVRIFNIYISSSCLLVVFVVRSAPGARTQRRTWRRTTSYLTTLQAFSCYNSFFALLFV